MVSNSSRESPSDEIYPAFDILAENPKEDAYLIKWTRDPDTDEPSPDEWAKRKDLTPDRVALWRQWKAENNVPENYTEIIHKDHWTRQKPNHRSQPLTLPAHPLHDLSPKRDLSPSRKRKRDSPSDDSPVYLRTPQGGMGKTSTKVGKPKKKTKLTPTPVAMKNGAPPLNTSSRLERSMQQARPSVDSASPAPPLVKQEQRQLLSSDTVLKIEREVINVIRSSSKPTVKSIQAHFDSMVHGENHHLIRQKINDATKKVARMVKDSKNNRFLILRPEFDRLPNHPAESESPKSSSPRSTSESFVITPQGRTLPTMPSQSSSSTSDPSTKVSPRKRVTKETPYVSVPKISARHSPFADGQHLESNDGFVSQAEENAVPSSEPEQGQYRDAGGVYMPTQAEPSWSQQDDSEQQDSTSEYIPPRASRSPDEETDEPYESLASDSEGGQVAQPIQVASVRGLDEPSSQPRWQSAPPSLRPSRRLKSRDAVPLEEEEEEEEALQVMPPSMPKAPLGQHTLDSARPELTAPQRGSPSPPNGSTPLHRDEEDPVSTPHSSNNAQSSHPQQSNVPESSPQEVDASQAQSSSTSQTKESEQAPSNSKTSSLFAFLGWSRNKEASKGPTEISQHNPPQPARDEPAAETSIHLDRSVEAPQPLPGQSKLESVANELRAKLSAVEATNKQLESDIDFFREKYHTASNFVSERNQQIRELEARVKIAEGQATDGVRLIRETFKAQLEELRREKESWQNQAQMIATMSARSGDLERNRQAAEYDELMGEYANLKQTSKELDAKNLKLAEKMILGKRELEEVQRENQTLMERIGMLEKAMAEPLRNGVRGVYGHSEDAMMSVGPEGSNGCVQPSQTISSAEVNNDEEVEEDVFVCKWRSADSMVCGQYFDSRKALADHAKSVHLEDKDM